MATTYANGPLVVLVGAGPGDPELITLAGARWLSRAEVVVYDRLANTSLLDLAPARAEKLYVGKAPGQPSASQDQIHGMLLERARQGKLVVRLKGGDPMMFGRGGEEADILREAGVPFRVVPGITAALAASAYAGIPLTDRRFSPAVVFATGHETPDKQEPSLDYGALARIGSVVIYMGVGRAGAIAEELIRSGRDAETPAALVEKASTPRQRTVLITLGSLAKSADGNAVRAPALIFVGDSVRMAEKLRWFEDLPLFGQTAIVTRTQSRRSGMSGLLSDLGAEVIEAPTVSVAPPNSLEAVDRAIARVGTYDWLLLTSPNGVDAMVNRLRACDMDARHLTGVKIAAVGESTANALSQNMLKADLVPERFTTEALGDALVSEGTDGKRYLLLRSDLATPLLPQMLRKAGGEVDDLVLYRTICPDSLPSAALAALSEDRPCWLTFASSSAVENFIRLCPAKHRRIWKQVRTAAIGPVTARTLAEHGMPASATADPHTLEAMVSAIAEASHPQPLSG